MTIVVLNEHSYYCVITMVMSVLMYGHEFRMFIVIMRGMIIGFFQSKPVHASVALDFNYCIT